MRCLAGRVCVVCQIGDGVVEHEYWGPPETEMTDRPSYDVSPQAVGSEPTAEAAAAMAAGYLVFKDEGKREGGLGLTRWGGVYRVAFVRVCGLM